MPDDTTKVIVVHRISEQVYKDLERKLGSPQPTSQTTDIQAGYMLGVQHVLKMIREGIVA